jgi:hypothetical protein
MSVTLSQVANTQSFGVWLERTNQMLSVFSTNTVTTDLTTIGALTTGNAYVNGVFGAVTVAATYLHGGNNTSNATLIVTSNATVNSTVLVGNSSSNVMVGFYPASNSLVYGSSNANTYIQAVFYNANGGTNATTDLVLNADNATDTTNYLDIGINSSGYSNASFTINGALDAYMYTANSGLAIGTASAFPIQFFTGGTLAANEVMRLDSGANVGIGNTNPQAKLHVQGTGIFVNNVQIRQELSVSNSFSSGNATVTGYVNASSFGKFGTNLDVGGYANVTGIFNATGASTLANTLSVTGNTTIANTLAVTGNVTFSNTLYVAGATTFANTVLVMGSDTIMNNLVVGNAVIMNANLSVNGAATYSNSMAITGSVSISNTINVLGSANLQSSLGVGSFANVAGNLRVGGDLIVVGNLAFTAQITGDMNPTQNNVYQLGNTTYRWIMFGTTANFSNTLTVSNTGFFQNNLVVSTGGSNSSFSTNLLFIDTTNFRVGIGNSAPGSRLTVNGMVESTTGGIKFPDATVQNTAAYPNGANSQIQFFDNTQPSRFNGNTNFTYNPANSTVSVTGNVYVTSAVSINTASISAGGFTATTTSAATLDSYSASQYRASEYLVQLSDTANSANFHSAKLLAIHDGTTASVTEFGTLITGSPLAVFAADINSGAVRVRITPVANTVTAKFVRTVITV